MENMSKRKCPALLLLLCTACTLPVKAPQSPQEGLKEAQEDWDEGRFIEALETMQALLLGDPGEDLQDRIALLTGELFQVTELAADGSGVRWSPDGRHAAFESGMNQDVMTHIWEISGSGIRELATVRGSAMAFSPNGDRAAYLTVPETEGYLEARARIEEESGGTDRASRMRLRTELARLESEHTVVTVRDLASGEEHRFQPSGLAVSSVLFSPDNGLYLVGGPADDASVSDIFRVGEDQGVTKITDGPGRKADPFFVAGGDMLVYSLGRGSFTVLGMATGEARTFQGSYPVVSLDGNTLAFLGTEGDGSVVNVLGLSRGGAEGPVTVSMPYSVSTSSTRACPTCPLHSGLGVSPDGSFAVVQARPREDWELFLVPLTEPEADPGIRQVTREIQHDLYPTVLADGRLLAMKGEGRHRRSHLYDLETGERLWLFRNNTTRTVAPEYEWAPSPDGSKLLVVAERDGNTVSPERGVYLMDLTRKVTRETLLARISDNLQAEKALRVLAESMYQPIRAEVQEVVDEISTTRLFEYQEALFQFGSKNVSQPGNRPAIDYIAGKLREFGYEPEFQWFEARGVETANVIARIPGSVSPDVVYAVSAHFDSNTRSPGADDNTSATVGLLEMARVLANHPMPATIEVALFTGEESGLLGSREYVRRAVESGKKLVGALNNDMVGFAEDHRLDNTIRYSNAGIRDLQHGAAILFSEMVTHDAEYYKSTDAAAYYDAYGDIVGGMGSYPILASPHYHQTHDVLETINHKLVTEVARMTTASAMLLASSPSRVIGLEASEAAGGQGVQVTWTPAVEADVTGYLVAFGPENDPLQHVERTDKTDLFVSGGAPEVVSVKAVNDRGMEGWDWARIQLRR
jgi:Tol biopolymer transport system component